MLHTGYHKVPSRNMVWELMGDCRKDFIAEALRQDTLESVMANLHFADNTMANQDKFFKVNLPNLTYLPYMIICRLV